jgi:type I restriction enzyme S subunit
MKENWTTALPEGWNLKQIRHIFRIHNGATPKSGDSEYWNGDINWITPEDLGNNVSKDIVESRRKITAEGYANSGVSLAPAGSIAISTRAPIGHLAKTTIPSCVNQGCRLLEPKEGNPDYWYYASIAAKPILVSRGQGTTFMELPRQSLASIKLPVPPIQAQQTIARFLDFKTEQIDALIAKKQDLLKKLAEKRTALISHAVTKGLDLSVPMKHSKVEWLGKIPAHWEAKRLKFVVSTFGGGTPNTGKPEYWNGEIPWVSPKDMKCDFIDVTEDYLTDLGVAESATKIVPVDSVLIVVRSGILRHTIPVARNTVEVSLNQDMKALVASDRLRPGFIHWFISGLQGGLLPLWSKQGCTVESIEMAYMINTVIPLPPLDEQDAILENITKITAKIDEQVNKVADAISALAEYRSSLITHAVTGKIDVRDFQAPQPVEGTAS